MKKIILNGKDLSIEQIHEIACCDIKVEIDEQSYKLIEDARQLVFDLVDKDVPVYGFNVGVGWNKDKAVFKDFFKKYNTNLILSHSLGVKPYLSCEQAKAVLVARLNNLLVGCTGIQPYIITFFKEMINKNIIPLIPLRGSVGNADITNLPHIGLTMLGLGKCYYEGEIIEAKKALEKAGMKPVELGPKDGLAIVSSNAFSAGIAALTINRADKLLKNVAVLNYLIAEIANEKINLTLKTPYEENNDVIEELSKFVGTTNKEVNSEYVNKVIYTIGSTRQYLNRLNVQFNIQLNSSDDNPCLLLEKRQIISCANYEPTNWAIILETLALSLCKTSNLIIEGLNKLDGNVSDKAKNLYAKIKHTANPSNNDFFSLAGDIEDHGNNTPHLVYKLNEIVDYLQELTALEVDLLKKQTEENLSNKAKSIITILKNDNNSIELLNTNLLAMEVNE